MNILEHILQVEAEFWLLQLRPNAQAVREALPNFKQKGSFALRSMRISMQTVSVSTLEYEIDVTALLLRRLRRIQGGAEIDVSPAADGRQARVRLRNEAERDALCGALAVLLLQDAAHFELARIVNDMPVSLEESSACCRKRLNWHAKPQPGKRG